MMIPSTSNPNGWLPRPAVFSIVGSDTYAKYTNAHFRVRNNQLRLFFGSIMISSEKPWGRRAYWLSVLGSRV